MVHDKDEVTSDIYDRERGLSGFIRFSLVRMVLIIIIMVFVLTLVGTMSQQQLSLENYNISLQFLILSIVIVHIMYLMLVSLFEKRQAYEFSLDNFYYEVFAGIVLGFLPIAIIVIILWILGYYQIISFNNINQTFLAFKLSLYAAYIEEILVRGILFRILEEISGTWISLGISSLVFGILHLPNPNTNAPLLIIFSIAIVSGLLLGGVYILTRRLWIAVALHFSINFTQGGIFGLPISGLTVSGVINAAVSGPEWITGGDFGIEASVLLLLVTIPFAVLIFYRIYAKENIVLPFWARKENSNPAITPKPDPENLF